MEKYFKPIPQNEITQKLQNLSIQGGSILKEKNNNDKKEQESSQHDISSTILIDIDQQLNSFQSVLQIHDKQILKEILDQYKNGISFEEISLNFQVSIKSIQKILPLNKEAQRQRQKQVRKQNYQKELETFCFLTDMQEKEGKKQIKKAKKEESMDVSQQSIVNSSK